MKTAQTIASVAAVDDLSAGHETVLSVPRASTLTAKLRQAVAHVTEWVTDGSPQKARTRFLCEATDLADLERRSDAWDRR